MDGTLKANLNENPFNPISELKDEFLRVLEKHRDKQIPGPKL